MFHLPAEPAPPGASTPHTSVSTSSSSPAPPQALSAARASLAAVPFGPGMSAVGHSARRQKRVRENATISKAFNVVAGRPQPALTSLCPQLVTTLAYTVPNYVTTSTTVPTYASTYFRLSDCFNYAPYTALFDQYKMLEVEVWLNPTAITTGVYGDFYTAVDLDDTTTPTSVNNVAQKPGALITAGQAGHYHRWTPHMAVAAYSGTFVSYLNADACWIDAASPSVQHYGLKCAFGASSTAAVVYDLQVRIKFAFRAPGVAA
jgi:hypothetical protein